MRKYIFYRVLKSGTQKNNIAAIIGTAFFLTVLLFSSCKAKKHRPVIDRAFYYWKSTLNPGSSELKALNDLQVKFMYVKFFDVSWNATSNEPMPIAVLNLPQQSAWSAYKIIPTVFITNDCIIKVKELQLKDLAGKIVLLIRNISSANNINTMPEIQIDCDWTASSKEKYFLLLQKIKDLIAPEKKLLSATIRLYQYKYFQKHGVPPVDRGLLMCYNMGNRKNPDTRNSILETGELEKYLNGPGEYPLPLDVALPVFSWKVLFRNNIYKGLINELPPGLLRNNPAIKQSGNKFEILRPMELAGYKFEPGDMLRNEEISVDDLVKSGNLLAQKLTTPRFTLVLYHLDSITLSKFSTDELETIFDCIR